ncbi:hypothetical protein [Natronococcus sp. A-GB7]|uniref:hypothetical protein n=1 Tax=Natronococcus sp. A-GB7 TaxID=3037649 RepID=UPI00241DA7FC|nr:hypothetical protein [Natronococcus sp. A-GB7]MDG5820202.1 hypothetical protein [Natronococcus sp. A-GB7]
MSHRHRVGGRDRRALFRQRLDHARTGCHLPIALGHIPLEAATEARREVVTKDCLGAALETTDREVTIETLLDLPTSHFLVLTGITGWTRGGTIEQPG